MADDIDEHTCLWPEGDPMSPGFRLCGAPVDKPGRPYCPAHADVRRQRTHGFGFRRSGIAALRAAEAGAPGSG